MITITKEFTFDAAHKLPNHQGLCRNLHGHTYRLIVEISGERETYPLSPSCGMLMDFGKFKNIIEKYILNQLDHHYLNEVFDSLTPTVENIVVWIADSLKETFQPYKLIKVVLYETANSYATWYADYEGGDR